MLTPISTLQAFWRKQTPIRKLAKEFLERMGKEMSYEALIDTLKDVRMLKISKKCLTRIVAHHAVDKQNVRVFLGAWLISRFPERVIGEHHAVVDGSKKMVHSFTALLEKIANDQRFPSVDEFITDLNAFFPVFENWRVPDQARLLEQIRAAITAVTTALAQAVDTPELVRELEQALIMLRVKEQKLV